ncbi:MAG TPA: helix-turn-helix transcriptional regulator [Streptosporangiaceae bacterium]|nr:helix-turn-helix transcriptional regulator [Streptosporangiaceae bacterium]
MAFFGAELRRARLAAGLSQEQLGRRLSFSGDLVGKVETGQRAPAPDFAAGCDGEFPHLDGLFTRLLGLARRWDGPHPQWFRGWIEAERQASALRWWEPMLVPGLLQTADYAQAILSVGLDTTEDTIDDLVTSRLERQDILSRPRPPQLWVALDEAVLRRLIGSRKVMREQLLHLADESRRQHITVQVVPADIGAHTGLLGAFIVADFEDAPSSLYAEMAIVGQWIEKPSVVRKAALAFDQLRAEALPRGASRDLIGKVAEQQWTD